MAGDTEQNLLRRNNDCMPMETCASNEKSKTGIQSKASASSSPLHSSQLASDQSTDNTPESTHAPTQMRTTSSPSSQTMPMMFLLASLLLRAATAASNTSCEPVSCGNLTISYPFSLAGAQPLDCGYPPLDLTCDNATIRRRPPQTYLSNTFRERLFRVTNISYVGNSMVAAIAGDGRGCLVPDFNVTASLALFPFTISRANSRLVFFHNCTVPHELRLPRPCGNRQIGAYISGRWDEADTLPQGVSRSCLSVSVPVRGGTEPARPHNSTSSSWSLHHLEELIADGFLLELPPPLGDCDACRRMRGECRLDKLLFQCICPNGKLCPSAGQDKRNFRLKICAGIATALLCLVALSIVCIFHNVRRKRKRSASLDNLILRGGSTLASPKKFTLTDSPLTHIFSYEELDEATDGFSDARVLGAGGFGTVYKGILRDGSVLAVKRLYKNSYKGVEQFANEVDILSRLRHPNLVAFYGCTSSSLGSCCRDLLLAYEFVPNGTLVNHLNCDGDAPFLAWPTRLGIAVEATGALAYLHAHQIVHRDVKTSNILLDEEFHVKVADFGLSRLFPPDATHVSTAPQGTPGYVDPTYHHMYHLTDKSDVYSFGVVLVELISSRPAVDMSQMGTDVNLASMAVRMIQCCEIDKLVDPRLGYKSASETMKTVDLVAEVAFRCLQPEQEVRPSITEVLDVLREAHQTMMERGGCGAKDDMLLLKKSRDGSPDSVMHQWISPSTTSNYST